MPPYHHSGTIKNITIQNAGTDEGGWHRKVPSPEELATHPRQTARRSTGLLVAGALAVSHWRRSRRQRRRLAPLLSLSFPPRLCLLLLSIFLRELAGNSVDEDETTGGRGLNRLIIVITPRWLPNEATPRGTSRHTRPLHGNRRDASAQRVRISTVSIKSPIVNSFPIAGETANCFHASNESQLHDSSSRFEGQSTKGSVPP